MKIENAQKGYNNHLSEIYHVFSVPLECQYGAEVKYAYTEWLLVSIGNAKRDHRIIGKEYRQLYCMIKGTRTSAVLHGGKIDRVINWLNKCSSAHEVLNVINYIVGIPVDDIEFYIETSFMNLLRYIRSDRKGERTKKQSSYTSVEDDIESEEISSDILNVFAAGLQY